MKVAKNINLINGKLIFALIVLFAFMIIYISRSIQESQKMNYSAAKLTEYPAESSSVNHASPQQAAGYSGSRIKFPDPKNIRLIHITPQTSVVLTLVPSSIPLPTLIVSVIPGSTSGTTYYINPGGQDNNDGLSVNRPFQTIQKAVDLAQPDDLIYLFPGVYQQDLLTKRDGLPGKPITITGPKEAVVTGAGNTRVFEVRHSYLTLKGFTIDGHYGSGTSISDFRDKLLYIIGKEPKRGVNGLKVSGMTFQNSGGECIRLRYFAQNNEVVKNFIKNCGIHDFRFNTGKKNGEGIYIGTAPEQRGDGKNPTNDPDESSNNWIHNNTIDTQGNECVDIKESSSGNMVENNSCTGQKDPKSGGMDSRGNRNTIRGNNIFDNGGAGIRLGGDSKDFGINNNIYGNIIRNNKRGGIKFEGTPQSEICGNTMFGNNGGDSVGTYRSQFNPTISCTTSFSLMENIGLINNNFTKIIGIAK